MFRCKTFLLFVCASIVVINHPLTAADLKVPEKYGLVKESFSSGSEHTVYFIQDAHCNEEAQVNIYQLLNYLVTTRQVDLITMEGAAGIIDPVDLRSFPYDDAKQIVSNYFLKNGRINGVEYYAINQSDPVLVTGIETPELYQENHTYFRDVFSGQSEHQFFVSLLDDLTTVKAAVYNDGQMRLEALDDSFEKNQTALFDYLIRLIALGKEQEVFDPRYGQLIKCEKMFSLENSLELSQVEKERAVLIRQLSEVMSKEDMESFLQTNLRFRLNKISYIEYMNYLFDLAFENDIDYEPLTSLTAYYEYLGLHQSIRHADVFPEIYMLSDEIFESFSTSEDQKRVRDVTRQIKMLEKAFLLQLTAEEWSELTAHPLFFADQATLAFFHRHSVEIGSGEAQLNRLNEYFQRVTKFYETAHKRDNAMVTNLLTRMQDNNVKNAVIVAGGYHASGVTHQLQEQGINYFLLGVNLTKTQENNQYTSIMNGYMSSIEQYFAGKWNTLAVASWLDENPMIADLDVAPFKDLFKSLLVSTLAWQLTGYDAASVRELNVQILNAVHVQLNSIAANLGYDVQVIELTRIQDQVYVRLNVNDQEVIYSLFADPAELDLSQLASQLEQDGNLISRLPLLGGEIVAITPGAYTNLVNLTNYQLLVSQLKEGDIVRSLFINPQSDRVLAIYALNLIHNKTGRDFLDTVDKIHAELARKGIPEEKAAVREALRTFLESSKKLGAIADRDGTWVVNEDLLYAAQMEEQFFDSAEGSLVEFVSPPDIEPEISDGKVEFLFADNSVPVDVLRNIFSLLSHQNGLGQYPLGSVGGKSYNVNFLKLSDDAIVAVVNSDERLPEYQNVELLYRSLLGEDMYDFSPETSIRINVGDKVGQVQRFSFQQTNGANEIIGDAVNLNYDDPETLDYGIEYLNRLQKRHGFRITALNGSYQSDDEAINFILETIFEHRQGVNRARDQYHEFLHILDAFTYAASKGMVRTQNILSQKIVDILRGKIPRFAALKDILDGTNTVSGITIDSDTSDLIYQIYLHHINYNPTNIDLNSIDPRILSRLLQQAYREEQPIPVGSAQERLLESLRGGPYLAKADFSPLEADSDQNAIYEIFADVDGMNKMFRNAGLLFSNTRRIRVSRSRLGGHLADYKVAVTDHQGGVTNIRLRVALNRFSARLLVVNVQNMAGAGPEFKEIIPDIYHYGQLDQIGYYFTKHIDGVLGDHILTHSEEYTEGEKLVRKYEAVKTWMKYWNLKLLPVPEDAVGDEQVERSRISMPVSLETVIFPDDTAESPKLRAIGMQPPGAESFYDLLFSVNIGLGLVRKDQITILASAVLVTFGYERTIELLAQALAQVRAREERNAVGVEGPNDITSAKIMQMVMYLRNMRNLMRRDTVRSYIDIAYGGDLVTAFNDLSRVAMEQDVSLTELLNGKFAKWKTKLPSRNEAKNLLRQTRPSVLTISGGTGGNGLINTVKDAIDGNMVNVVTTFDAGGQSYVWQNILAPMIGYVPSKGDTTNLISAYLPEGMQDLLAKRLPDDYEGDTIFPVIRDLIEPTLARYPELRETPEFLIDFIDIIKIVDEFLAEVNRRLPDGQKVNLKKASLKNLVDESLYYFAGVYDFDSGFFDAQKAEIALFIEHKLFNANRGIVVPVSKEKGTLVARLKQGVPQGQGVLSQEEIQLMRQELGEDTGLRMNKISDDGTTIFGEDFIGEGAKIIKGLGSRIDHLDVAEQPNRPTVKPPISPVAVEALDYPSLDLVLFGPGSLYTSLLANFTISDVVESLAARGKKREIKYPDGRVEVIESAKRVIILNPRYAAEDSGMSIREMILTIERTAQNAANNPDLRFEDMFDAIVVNDPAQAPENVQEYIRSNNLDVIQPTQEDREFFIERGVEVYTYNLVDIQLRASRTPGFELQYDERLIYSPKKLSMVVRTLQTDSRIRKMEDLKNIGVGDGHHSPQDLLRVKEIIRKASLKGSPGSVRRINREKRPFVQRGVEHLQRKAQELAERISTELDTVRQTQMQSDLEIMRQTITAIESGKVPLFAVRPVDNSRGIFIDDISRYQFATFIEASERNVQRGIYLSAGLVELIEENLQVERKALREGDISTAEKFAETAASLAAEALFIQFSEWMLYQKEGDKFQTAPVHADMKRIAQRYISIDSNIPGGLLYSKISAVVKSELYARHFTDLETMLNIAPELSTEGKIAAINTKILKASRAQTIRNSFTESLIGIPIALLEQVKQLYVFGPIIEDIVSDEEVLEIVQQAGYTTFYDLMVATAEQLAQSEENFRREITPELLEQWNGQFQTLDTLFGVLKYKIDSQRQNASGSQRTLYKNMKQLISNMSNNIKPLNNLLGELQADPELREVLNVTRVVRISHMRDYVEELRTSTLRVDEQPESYEEISEAIINRRAEFKEMNIDALSQAIEEHFIREAEEDISPLRRDVEQFFTLLTLVKNAFPRVTGIDYTELPDDATTTERTLARAYASIEAFAPYRELNDYGKIVNFGTVFLSPDKLRTISPLFLASHPDVNVRNLLRDMRDLFTQIEANYANVKETISEFRKDYPTAMDRFEQSLRSKGKLPPKNIGLGDGHTSEDPNRLRGIIGNANLELLSNDDLLINGVKQHLRYRADLIFIESQHQTNDSDKRRLERISDFLSLIYSKIDRGSLDPAARVDREKYIPFNFYSVAPTDGNPALYIDSADQFQFATVMGNNVYFSKGLLDRVRLYLNRGQTQLAVEMLTEAIIHELGEQFYKEQQGDEFDALKVHDTMKEFGYAVNRPSAPISDLPESPETILFTELRSIVNNYLNSGITDVTALPVFNYPSDNNTLRADVQNKVLSDEMDISAFLDLMIQHFQPAMQLGAPEALLYNHTYYHPGDVYGFIGEAELLPDGSRNTHHVEVGETIIKLTNASPIHQEKADLAIKLLLTDAKYRPFVDALSPHKLEDFMYDIIRIITGNDDPYKALKDTYNGLGVENLPVMEQIIDANTQDTSQDQLRSAVLVAIAGNALDFADLGVDKELSETGFSFADAITEILEPGQTFGIDHFEQLADRLAAKPAQKILFSVDNAGEIATDLPLLKRLLVHGHQVVLVSRWKHTVNDISYVDAQQFFARSDVQAYMTDTAGNSLLTPEQFSIIHSGSNVTGTDLRYATPEFIEAWNQADIRLFKGQGNYETLQTSPLKQDVFFLVKIKNPLSTANRFAKGEVLIEHKVPNPVILSYVAGDLEAVEAELIPRVDPAERKDIEEFIIFYIDHISKQISELTITGEQDKIAQLLVEAQRLLEKAQSIPDINIGLLAKLHRDLRTNSPVEDIIIQLTETNTVDVASPSQASRKEYVLIDFDTIPDADLQNTVTLLNILAKDRSTQQTPSVKWVIYSEKYSSTHIMEEILQRKFINDDMDLFFIGDDTVQEYGRDNPVFAPSTNFLGDVLQTIAGLFSGEAIGGSRVKVLTATESSASYGVRMGAYAILLPKRDSLSDIHDFTTAVVSIDSLINGGRLPNLVINDVRTKNITDLQTLANGSVVTGDILAGKILGLQSQQPQPVKLRQIELRRALDEAI